jgi:hypothetical protein
MVKKWFLSKATLSRVFALCAVGWLARANSLILLASLAAPEKKDFRSGYLLAKAMLNGVWPYQPLSELAKLWLPGQVFKDFLHPTPHPFAVGWLCLPLAYFSYPQAAALWLVFELFCLLVAIVLGLCIFRQPLQLWRVAICLLVGLAWPPLATELWYGQLSLCLVALFLGAWLALREGRELTGGALLGSLAVLKLMGGPVLLWLAWQRRWRAVGAAAAVWLGAHALAVGVHGWALVHTYYFTVGPQVSALYRTQEFNLSLWTLGQRLFGEMNWFVVTVPLWRAPFLAKLLGLLAPLGMLGWLMYAACRARRFETGFALLMGGGFLLMPVVWGHYLVMALPAVCWVLLLLAERQWPWRWTTGVGLTLAALSLPHNVYYALMRAFAQGADSHGLALIPALPGLVILMPMAALCLLLWQLVALESVPAAEKTALPWPLLPTGEAIQSPQALRPH